MSTKKKNRFSSNEKEISALSNSIAKGIENAYAEKSDAIVSGYSKNTGRSGTKKPSDDASTARKNRFVSTDGILHNNPAFVYAATEKSKPVRKASDATVKGSTIPQEDVEWYKKILRGIDTGLTRAGKSLVSAADVITSLGDEEGGPLQELWYMFGGDRIFESAGDNALGIKGLDFKDNPIKALNKLGEKEVEYRQNRDASYQNDPLYKYSSMASESASMMLPTIMSGGATAAADTAAVVNASRLGQATSKLAQAGAISKNAIKEFASRPDAKYIFATTAGSSYDEAKQDGADDLQALAYAALNSAASTVTELGGISELGGLQKLPEWVKNAVKSGNKSLLLKYVKSVGEEISEEIIQGVLGRGLKSIYSDVPLYDPDNENSIINPKAALEEAKGAAVVTTLLGLPTTGVNAAYRAKQRGELGNQLYGDVQRELVDEGLDNEWGSKSYELAQKYNKKLNSGKQLTGNELYRLAQANEKAITNEASSRSNVQNNEPVRNSDTMQLPSAVMSRSTDIAEQIARNAPTRGITGFSTEEIAIGATANDMASKYKVSKSLIGKIYNLAPTATPQVFEASFDAAYKMGAENADTSLLAQVPGLSEQQAMLAYNIGKEKGMEVKNNEIRVREGSERAASEDTSRQVPAVEERPRADKGRETESKSAVRERVENANGQLIYDGKVQDGITIAMDETKPMRQGRELAENMGYEVTYFKGGNLSIENGSVRGAVDTAAKTVYVRADHPELDAYQIMRHEMGHERIASGELILDDVRDMLHETFTDAELDEISQRYADAYTMEDGSSVLTAEEAFEEICCDALGKINIFAGTEHNSANYERALEAIRKHAAQTSNSQGRAPPRSGVKYSKQIEDKYFARQIERWDGKDHGGAFRVGEVSKPLLSVGIPNTDIWFDQSKAAKQLLEKGEITKAVIKQIPEILQHPIAISESYDNTVMIFGQVFDANSNPIVVALRVNSTKRRNSITLVNKIRSVGSRSHNLDKLLSESKILYLGENKKETKTWFNALGRSTPFGGTKFGFIRSVSFSGDAVKKYSLEPQEDAKAKATALYQGSKVTVPKMPNTSDGFVSSIRDVNSPVKLKIKDVTESRQFKRWFGNSKVVNADGSPKIVYHQTENDFTVFDTRREGAGTRDNGTPFGIFLKSSNRDIGLKGKKQMALYARIVNPLRARDRSELTRLIRNMSPEYDALITQHETLDREYKSKTQQAIKELKDFMINWRANNPGADSRSLYDVSEFNALFDAEDALANEWTAKADELSTKAKNVMTNALESNGYDGVILENDTGSFGRSTDAYIALHPEQIKSATDNIGAFDESNPDIRYSREPEGLAELRRQYEELLGTAATNEDTANENERGMLRDYKRIYDKVKGIEEDMNEAERELNEAKTARANRDIVTKLANRYTMLNAKYTKEHQKLFSLSKSKPMTDILNRTKKRTNFVTRGERWVTEEKEQGDNALHPISNEQRTNLSEQQNRSPQEIPKKDLEGKLTSKHVSTIVNSGITPAEFSDAMLEDAAQGKFSHIPYDDETALNKANRIIKIDGWEQALADYRAAVNRGIVSKDITVMGIALYNNAVSNGDYATAMDIASLMVKNSTTTAQALQAMRILNKLSPECKLYLAAKSIETIQEDINKRYKDNKADIHVDKVLYDEYARALRDGSENDIKDAWAKIEQTVAQQIPATLYEKLNSFRYLSMLGNPRTHIRNIVGNAFFVPVRAIKNTIAYVIEETVDKKVTGSIERSKAMLNAKNPEDAALIRFAMNDYAVVQDVIMSGGKYIDSFQGIDKHRTIYKTKWLEAFRKGNSNLLDKEDNWYCKPAYAHALARYFKANGISAEQLNTGAVPEDIIVKAQTIAIREAQKATYRDINWFSQKVTKLGKVENKVGAVLIEGLLPFKKTPANILARAVEYSPVGLVKTLTLDSKKLKAYMEGNVEDGVSPAQFIDDVSAGLTGTALMGLGIMLAAMGVLTGGDSDDEKQNNFDELSGKQNYSINIGGWSITLDWLAPESMPLFVGVELFNAFSGKNEDNGALQNFTSALMSLSTPMFEMSMLQSVNDLFDNLRYIKQGQGAFKIVSSMAANYISQYIPTLFGQIERAFTENQRETTYIDRNSKTGSELQYMWGKIANKIPFYDFSQIPYIDAWGRTENTGNLFERVLNNFINPAYVKENSGTPIDDELQRLYDLGETSVYPSRAATNTKINGEYLTADEYVTYATTKGQTSYNLAEEVINSSVYKSASDPEKAYILKYIYSYSDHIAKYTVNSESKLTKWEEAAYKSGNPTQAIIDHAIKYYDPEKGNN